MFVTWIFRWLYEEIRHLDDKAPWLMPPEFAFLKFDNILIMPALWVWLDLHSIMRIQDTARLSWIQYNNQVGRMNFCFSGNYIDDDRRWVVCCDYPFFQRNKSSKAYPAGLNTTQTKSIYTICRCTCISRRWLLKTYFESSFTIRSTKQALRSGNGLIITFTYSYDI